MASDHGAPQEAIRPMSGPRYVFMNAIKSMSILLIHCSVRGNARSHRILRRLPQTQLGTKRTFCAYACRITSLGGSPGSVLVAVDTEVRVMLGCRHSSTKPAGF